jgi:hypothetical protein
MSCGFGILKIKTPGTKSVTPSLTGSCREESTPVELLLCQAETTLMLRTVRIASELESASQLGGGRSTVANAQN